MLKNINFSECVNAFCRGDRLGAPWETGEVGWLPVPYEAILKRENYYLNGTDETDIVECFSRFTENYMFDGDREKLLLSWADFHERNHRVTSYGGSWRAYFQNIKYLRKKSKLTLEFLKQCTSETKPGGSAGNGFLALVLPVYNYALIIGEDRHDLVQEFVALSHSHPRALGCASFLTNLFDWIEGLQPELNLDDCCKSIANYYGAGSDDLNPGWQLSPEKFAQAYPDNIICCNTVIHALYTAQTCGAEEEVISKSIALRGDVDSVLALALMLYRLFSGKQLFGLG